ncbi:PREDICTED: uncharacterized protein LOC104750182 [Camelina sativa]|uniref:Uncharacterized protein LOC104750182 n=1 Tax=Camelina sativa TaxID=90675 RepID=A0ABM1R1Z1_CAMSA|nr:PREDICTED: uncharacterized protein LOC104750182 [Camelina sativa]
MFQSSLLLSAGKYPEEMALCLRSRFHFQSIAQMKIQCLRLDVILRFVRLGLIRLGVFFFCLYFVKQVLVGGFCHCLLVCYSLVDHERTQCRTSQPLTTMHFSLDFV